MHIVSVIRKKTNISCICQKSELNSQEIGVFRWYFGNSSDHFEENGSQKVGGLVVLGFNATLTAKVISWRSVTHMCFLAFSHQY